MQSDGINSAVNQHKPMKTYLCIEQDENGNDYESDRGEFSSLSEAQDHFGWEDISDDFRVVLA